jgi:1-phosphofructokinase family hexose kinase
VILTVTLNPAWDVTYPVATLRPGDTVRTGPVSGRAGGKGVNVARVLHQLGHATLATGPLGGPLAGEFRAELDRADLGHEFVGVAAPTRSTVTVVEADGRATVLAEPGPDLAESWPVLLARLEEQIARAELVVLAGSLPAGLPPDTYGVLVDLARRRAVMSIVDSGGDALRHAVAAGPDLVKPNREELRAATGSESIVDGMCALLGAGARRVVVSAGPDGLVGATETQCWQAKPAPLAAVNATGAGDAAVAALAVGLLAEDDWPELLRRAVAWSAAAVLEPLAGTVAVHRLAELADTTYITEERPAC